MRRIKIFTIVIISICFLISTMPLQASENNIKVVEIAYIDDDFDSSTPGWQIDHFDFIQDGIDVVENLGTVYVNNGLYVENVLINKTIDLIGENKEFTIIDANQNGDGIFITANNVNVSHFSIRNADAPSSINYNAGIHIDSDFNTIYDNIIYDNLCGIYSSIVNFNFVNKNIIHHNTEYGMFAASSSDDTKIIDNIFYENYLSLQIQASSNCNVIRNQFNNSNMGLYFCCGSNNNLIYHNSFWNNTLWNIDDTNPNQRYDNGYPSGGNYWDDYNGSDDNGDWIGDTPYNISDGYHQDNYPLMYPYDGTGLQDVNQSTQDRGFPIRHATDGDWGGAQNFTIKFNTLTKIKIYLRKFGNPEFDLIVELRENNVEGTLKDTITLTPAEVLSSWQWLEIDFTDTPVNQANTYFIVLPPAPSGVTTSFGYEWGYAFGNQYPDGAFWFTRDGGSLWRDLPTMYEFVFRTYGVS